MNANVNPFLKNRCSVFSRRGIQNLKQVFDKSTTMTYLTDGRVSFNSTRVILPRLAPMLYSSYYWKVNSARSSF